jgi:hypothetical protein
MTRGYTNAAEAESAFYRAFETLDLALMERVWSEGDEAACVHPGGDLLRGKAAVMQSWQEILGSAARPTIAYRVLHTLTDGGLAVHLVEEMIRPSGVSGSEASRVLASNVYRLGPDGWHMEQHHASLPVMRRRGATDGPKLH